MEQMTQNWQQKISSAIDFRWKTSNLQLGLHRWCLNCFLKELKVVLMLQAFFASLLMESIVISALWKVLKKHAVTFVIHVVGTPSINSSQRSYVVWSALNLIKLRNVGILKWIFPLEDDTKCVFKIFPVRIKTCTIMSFQFCVKMYTKGVYSLLFPLWNFQLFLEWALHMPQLAVAGDSLWILAPQIKLFMLCCQRRLV